MSAAIIDPSSVQGTSIKAKPKTSVPIKTTFMETATAGTTTIDCGDVVCLDMSDTNGINSYCNKGDCIGNACEENSQQNTTCPRHRASKKPRRCFQTKVASDNGASQSNIQTEVPSLSLRATLPLVEIPSLVVIARSAALQQPSSLSPPSSSPFSSISSPSSSSRNAVTLAPAATVGPAKTSKTTETSTEHSPPSAAKSPYILPTVLASRVSLAAPTEALHVSSTPLSAQPLQACENTTPSFPFTPHASHVAEEITPTMTITMAATTPPVLTSPTIATTSNTTSTKTLLQSVTTTTKTTTTTTTTRKDSLRDAALHDVSANRYSLASFKRTPIKHHDAQRDIDWDSDDAWGLRCVWERQECSFNMVRGLCLKDFSRAMRVVSAASRYESDRLGVEQGDVSEWFIPSLGITAGRFGLAVLSTRGFSGTSPFLPEESKEDRARRVSCACGFSSPSFDVSKR